jgi:thymidylate synthase ThyX
MEKSPIMFNEDYETFSPEQTQLLEHYVTNTSSHIFALRNLPEVIKGALFSRYSRSPLGLRSLLLQEFIGNEQEALFSAISGAAETSSSEQQTTAIQKAQNFYDRILDGYGDDSIGELGGAHLAVENVSLLAAKQLEDCRIGGSPLEKSTRYVYFDRKVQDEYLFYRDPILMTSAYRDLYIDTCNHLFDTYSQAIPPLTLLLEKQMPMQSGISPVAYKAALRAKVLDCLRGLLPASTLTNVGIFGNGRYYESLLHKLHCQSLAEMQNMGKNIYEELAKIIPSFVRRADPNHRTHVRYAAFSDTIQGDLKQLAELYSCDVERHFAPGVRLLDYDIRSPFKVAAGLLYPYTDKGIAELEQHCAQLPEEELARILEAASENRENRRHKSPRALESANFTFEIIADYGTYRDLQRHRMLSQEHQLLTCDYGFYTPPDLHGTPQEEAYANALLRAKQAYTEIAAELPEEAQYVVPQAYRIRWYLNINLRALQWLCELRSAPAGHPSYRYIAQEMARQISIACPAFQRFFKFVDFEGYELGRLSQEQRSVEKHLHRSNYS